MFEKQLMLSGLRRQHILLNNLIQDIEKNSCEDLRRSNLCEEKTEQVAKNLKKLRAIKDTYFQFSENMNKKNHQKSDAAPHLTTKELERWMLRTGILPESNLGVSRSGLFADFD